jgi:superfamily II DNA or RNA helicase
MLMNRQTAQAPLNLQLVDLKADYRSGEQNLLTDFYIPCLQQSRKYYRAVGFFSSTALAAAARGLARFIQTSGDMYIVASPILDEDDVKSLIDAWKDAQKYEHVITGTLLKALDPRELESLLVRRRLECLAWLVSERRLQIRIAVPQVDLGLDPRCIYHEKLGIFEDDSGQSVAFTGSINETASGWSGNFEAFDVYASWRPEDLPRVRRKREIFEKLWTDTTSGLRVMEVPEAAKEKLIRLRPAAPPVLDPEEEIAASEPGRDTAMSRRQLWPHQQTAISAWQENNFRGILAMATGTGKTLAALHAMALAPASTGTIVLVPTLLLVDQWIGEMRQFFGKCHIVECTSKAGSWPQTLSAHLGVLRTTGPLADAGSRLLVIATIATAAGDKFQLCWNSYPPELTQIVADEVHHLGAPEFQKCLRLPSVRRLGLSATPERQWDEPGTDAIVGYFGSTVFEYPVKDAIRDGRLCHYEYRPFFAYLDDEEFDEYYQLTKEIEKFLAAVRERGETEVAVKFSAQLHRLLENRALIKKKAKDKVRAFRQILEDSPPAPFIVFCEDQEQIGSIRGVFKDKGVSFVTYTSAQSTWQRGKTLELFRDSSTNAVLAIRCLDEGVDVPDCKACVIVASSSSEREFIQRRGRVLRLSKPAKKAIVYDIVLLPILPKLMRESAVAEKLVRQEIARVNYFVEASDNEWSVRRKIKQELEQFGLEALTCPQLLYHFLC